MAALGDDLERSQCFGFLINTQSGSHRAVMTRGLALGLIQHSYCPAVVSVSGWQSTLSTVYNNGVSLVSLLVHFAVKTRPYPRQSDIVLSFFKDSGMHPYPHRRQNPALRLDDVL